MEDAGTGCPARKKHCSETASATVQTSDSDELDTSGKQLQTSTADAPTHTAPSSHRDDHPGRLLFLPSALALHLCDAYLTDADARSLACSSRAALDMLSAYKIKRAMPSRLLRSFLPVEPATDSAGQVAASSNSGGLPAPLHFGAVTHVLLVPHEDPAAGLPLLPDLLPVLPRGVHSLSAATRFQLAGSDPPAFGELLPLLPASITHLDLYHVPDYLPWPRQVTMPPALRTLILPFYLHANLSGMRLPDSLQELYFPAEAIIPVERWPVLPPRLKKLCTGGSFNSSVAGLVLPDSLELLAFDANDQTPFSCFNHESITSLALPRSLRVLRLNGLNKPLGAWTSPPQLHTLELQEYNQPLCEWLPPESLRALKLSCFDRPAGELKLPPHLEVLDMAWYRRDASQLKLPHTITNLTLSSDRGLPAAVSRIQWPPQLHTLKFGDGFDLPLTHWRPPASLTSLTLSRDWCYDVRQLRLPSGLTSLNFGKHFGFTLRGLQFPPSLTSLDLGCTFQQPLKQGHWSPPPALTHLTLSRDWRSPISELQLPDTLRVLRFCDDGSFNEEVSGWALPPQLEELVFGLHFERSLHALTLPASLRLLRLSRRQRLTAERMPLLPAGLKQFRCKAWHQLDSEERAWAETALPVDCALLP